MWLNSAPLPSTSLANDPSLGDDRVLEAVGVRPCHRLAGGDGELRWVELEVLDDHRRVVRDLGRVGRTRPQRSATDRDEGDDADDRHQRRGGQIDAAADGRQERRGEQHQRGDLDDEGEHGLR